MACLYLLLDIFGPTSSSQAQQNLAHLGMAIGWFGRLSADDSRDFAFKELVQLVSLAQQHCSATK
jgi:hypothetical protein